VRRGRWILAGAAAGGLLTCLGGGYLLLGLPGTRRAEGLRPASRPERSTLEYRDPFLERLRAEVSGSGQDAAVAAYRRQLAAHPDDGEAYAALGVLLFLEGRRTFARPALERAALAGVTYGAVFRALGSLSLDRGDLEQAALAFRRETMLTPDNPRAFFDLGLVSLRLEELRDAVAALRRAAELSPGAAEVRHVLGVAYLLRGELGAAEGELRRCLDYEPENHVAWNDFGQVQLALGRLPEAERAFRRAIELEPDRGEYFVGLAQALVRRATAPPDLAAARAALLRAQALEPHSGDAWALLADVYRQEGRPDEALAALRETARLKPESGSARYALAQALRQAGRDAEATRELGRLGDPSRARRRRFLQREIDFNPERAGTRLELGLLYEQLKDYRRAAHQFRQLARLEPENARASRLLMRANRELRAAERAAKRAPGADTARGRP
jgi:cytochrome c-type biogenesis protein CcmH/NrfG